MSLADFLVTETGAQHAAASAITGSMRGKRLELKGRRPRDAFLPWHHNSMTRLHSIGLAALAVAGLFPSFAPADLPLNDWPRPDCAALDKSALDMAAQDNASQGKMVEDGPRLAACDALARHLAEAFPDLDPAGLRLVLTRATPDAMSGRIERVDGLARGPDVGLDAQDGPLSAADIDHFAQNALIQFLFR